MAALSPSDKLLVENGGLSAAERTQYTPAQLAKLDSINPDTAPPNGAIWKKAQALKPSDPPPVSVDNPTRETTYVVYTQGQVEDPNGAAKQQAIDQAAASGNMVIIKAVVKNSKGETVDTFEVIQPPPTRDSDIKKTVDGTPPSGETKVNGVPKDIPLPSPRPQAAASQNAQANIGCKDAADEGDGKVSDGTVKNQIAQFLNNTPRVLGGVIPALEGIMMGIPQSALGKFTSLLPPAFKSLLPVGSVAGLLSKGPVQLSGLTNLVAGAALGQVAGQALRSLTGGPAAISGLTGALGAQAVARVSGSTAIPVNIASTFGNALLSNAAGNVAGNLASNALGSSPATAGVIANVVGVVTNVALNQRSGVPVNSQILGLAANVALRSAGVPTSIPTSVLGLASSSAMNPLAALIGGSVSGRIPVLPGNLSLPNVGALSGLSQNLSPELAENLIPPNQLQGLLPGNLQAQIPGVPPRVSSGSPYTQNDVQTRREASPNSTGPIEPAKDPTKQDAMVKGAGGGNVNYGMKISKIYTLGDFCQTPTMTPRRDLRDTSAYSVDQLIENLSWLAVNLVEPIKEQFPGFTINSGYDYPVPGSNRVKKSQHFEGSAIDLQWLGSMKDYDANMRRCEWIVKNLPFRGCILEWAGNGIWIHVDGKKVNTLEKYWGTFKNHSKISSGKFVNPMF